MLNNINIICPELLEHTATGWNLLGNRCTNCGEIFFPASAGCTRCCAEIFQPYNLGAEGILWSWTIQSFRPKEPYDGTESDAQFIPYGVGYVEMPSGIKVESRLISESLENLKIGTKLHLVLEHYRTAPSGDKVYTYAFADAFAEPSMAARA
jgi:uncharacterized OB-fold protein